MSGVRLDRNQTPIPWTFTSLIASSVVTVDMGVASGEKSVEYLMGRRAVLPYRLLFVAAVFIGAGQEMKLVWSFSDVMNGLMAVPNLIGLLLLSGVIATETRSYFLARETKADVEGR